MDTGALQNGPVMDRGCTDIICCLVFVAFLVGMVGCAGYGSLYGDPGKLLTAWDADKNGCGYSKPTLEYPYLYFPTVDFAAAKKMSATLQGGKVESPLKSVGEILRFSTCVKQCPKGTTGEVVECREPKFMFDKNGKPKQTYKNCVY